MTTAERGRIVVWRQRDGFWRWQYVLEGADGAGTERFVSHTEFVDRDEARRSAQVAFQGVPVEDVGEPSRRARRPVAGAFLLVAVAVAVRVVAGRIRRRRACDRQRRLPPAR